MTSKKFVTTGRLPQIKRVESFAFHDAAGRIRHMHHHIVLEGAEPCPHQAVLDEIMAQALSLGNDLSKLRVLQITESFNFGAQYRVDVKKGVLVERRPPAPKHSSHARRSNKKR